MWIKVFLNMWLVLSNPGSLDIGRVCILLQYDISVHINAACLAAFNVFCYYAKNDSHVCCKSLCVIVCAERKVARIENAIKGVKSLYELCYRTLERKGVY